MPANQTPEPDGDSSPETDSVEESPNTLRNKNDSAENNGSHVLNCESNIPSIGRSVTFTYDDVASARKDKSKSNKPRTTDLYVPQIITYVYDKNLFRPKEDSGNQPDTGT